MTHGSKSVFAVLLLTWIGGHSVSFGQSPIDQVSQALVELNQWLGEDENSRRWKSHLRTDDVIHQLSRGAAADPKVLAEIHAAYSGSDPGLSSRRFVAVREALEKWMEAAPVPLSQIPEAARAERENFRMASPERVAAERSQLITRRAALEAFLNGSSAANVAAWKEYLQWDALQQELDKAGGPSPVALLGIAERYTANEQGLELPYFADVRRSLQDYAYAIYFAQGTQAREAYAQHLEEIAKRLEAYSQTRTIDDAAAVGRSVGWLARGGQAPQLVSSVRTLFDEPNLYAAVSDRLVGTGVETEEVRARLNQPQAVRDLILKTSIYGTAYPNLRMQVALVPSNEAAVFDVQMYGAASSNNMGYQGPVTIHTTGYTSINAVKRVYFNELGLAAYGAGASCATSTTIHNISSCCGLIEKFAWRQAGKTKSQAEAIASQHAEWRIQRQLDREIGARLAEANQSYAERIRNRLLRRDGFPRRFHASTTENQVTLRVLHATPQQLAAGTQPPPLSEDHDLAVRVHESLVINFGESLLGGVTLTDERLVELLTEAKAEIPEELQITPDKDPWSITFTPERPVAAEFKEDTVRMAIRGRRFTRGDQEVRAVMEISATYQLERSGTGSKLTRQGDVVAEYVNRERQSIGEVAMKTFLRKKFESLFKPEITSEGLVLSEQLRGVGKLHLKQLQADQGWIVLGWQKPDGAENVASTELANRELR